MASRHASVTELIAQPDIRPTDGFHRSTPWYVVFVFVIPVEEGILQVHFHDSSPFDTHPVNMWIFLFALLVYSIALGYYVKSWPRGSTNILDVCNQVGYVSGSLASAALVSVMVPPYFEIFIFVIWILVSTLFVDFTRQWIPNVAHKLIDFGKDAASCVQNIWKGITRVITNVGATVISV